MPETPSAGEIFRRMNEARARAAEAERRAEDLTDAAHRKAKEDRIVTPPPGLTVQPDPELMEQANAARAEAWEATAEAMRLKEELGDAPTDEDILGEAEFVDPTIGPTNEQQRAEAAGTATWLYRALRDPTTWIRLAGAGLGALGLFLLMQGLNAQAQQVPGGAAASAAPPAAASRSPITQASPPAPTTARPVTPLSAAPIVVKPIVAVAGPTTEYVVAIERMPPQDAPTFSWSGATCGLATATADRYSWDHREQVVSITGGLGTRELGRSGNCDHRADPSHGNPLIVAEIRSQSFTARCTIHGAGSGTGEPCEVKAATAPAAAPATATTATVPAGPTTVTAGGGPNIALSALGFVLLVGAIGLFFGGPRLAGGPEEPSWWSQIKEWWSSRGKDHAKHAVGGPRLAGGPLIPQQQPAEGPCAKEKAAEAAARARLDEAEAWLDRLNSLRADPQIPRTEAEQRDAVSGRADAWHLGASADWHDANNALQKCLGVSAPAAAPTTGGGTSTGERASGPLPR